MLGMISIKKANWILWSFVAASVTFLIRSIDWCLQYFHINTMSSVLTIIQIGLGGFGMLLLISGWFARWKSGREEKDGKQFSSNRSSVVLSALIILFLILPFPKFAQSHHHMDNGKIRKFSKINNNPKCEVPTRSLNNDLNDGMKPDNMSIMPDSSHDSTGTLIHLEKH